MEANYETSSRLINDIEWVSYTPRENRRRVPLLFQHGMWHGAWCWRQWQELLAEQGWESHAISLPGHGKSPIQRAVRFCTLNYYLSFVAEAVASLSEKPVLIGHSMGGALTQRYLKKVGDDLPGAALVAPWTSHSTWADGMGLHLKRDPWGLLLVGLTFSTDPLIRNAERAASMLITDNALLTPEQLFSKLDRESAVVLNQHNPPFWRPLANPKTPMLWLGAEKDAVISLDGARKSAAFYGAEFALIENAGHNLMMEWNYRETAMLLHDWLLRTLD